MYTLHKSGEPFPKHCFHDIHRETIILFLCKCTSTISDLKTAQELCIIENLLTDHQHDPSACQFAIINNFGHQKGKNGLSELHAKNQ